MVISDHSLNHSFSLGQPNLHCGFSVGLPGDHLVPTTKPTTKHLLTHLWQAGNLGGKTRNHSKNVPKEERAGAAQTDWGHQRITDPVGLEEPKNTALVETAKSSSIFPVQQEKWVIPPLNPVSSNCPWEQLHQPHTKRMVPGYVVTLSQQLSKHQKMQKRPKTESAHHRRGQGKG